jgi:hypothetical protein
MRGPGEVHGTSQRSDCGKFTYRACFQHLHVEYSQELVRDVLADVTGVSFDRWIHASLLNSL